MLPRLIIHKQTSASPDGKTHNQIDHILMDKRQHSNTVDAQSVTGAD
jgi:hypothetical protein